MLSFLRTTRRAFLRNGSLALAGIGLRGESVPSGTAAGLDPSALTPFVDPLPIPPLARPSGMRANPENPAEKIPYYRIDAREMRVKVHRDLPPTRMWSFGDSFP